MDNAPMDNYAQGDRAPAPPIPDAQNTALNLARLAAQRRLYSRAKTVEVVQLIFTVPVVVLWSFLVLWHRQWEAGAALYGEVLTMLDLFLLTPYQRTLKERAAKIQELFDCEVLDLPWHDVKLGPRPAAEEVLEWSGGVQRPEPDLSLLRDWYPVSARTLPRPLARLVCQRANVWWDAKLRRRYAGWVVGGVAAVTVSVLTVSFLGGLTFERFVLAGVSPLLPVLVLAHREYNEQMEAARTCDELRAHAERLWDAALAARVSPDELRVDGRDLQDEIYDRRRRSPLIFDWVYRRLRREDEELMNRGAEQLVEQATKQE